MFIAVEEWFRQISGKIQVVSSWFRRGFVMVSLSFAALSCMLGGC